MQLAYLKTGILFPHSTARHLQPDLSMNGHQGLCQCRTPGDHLIGRALFEICLPFAFL
jgi:hypothetical protein